MEMMAKRFINARSLKLDEFKNIDDDDLDTLCKLSILTVLDVTGGEFWGRKITNRNVSSLASLSALKELHLQNRGEITNVGLQHLSCLTSLTKFHWSYDYDISEEDARHLGNWIGSRDLTLTRCKKMFDVKVKYLEPLTSLTELCLCNFHEVSDKGARASRDLSLPHCYYISEIGVQHLAPLISLTKLSLKWCSYLSAKHVRALGNLMALRDLNLRGGCKIQMMGCNTWDP